MLQILFAGVLALPSLPPALSLPVIQSPEQLILELYDEEDPERLIARADKLLLDKRFDVKGRAWLHVSRGRGYRDLRKSAEARAAFDKAVELNGKNDLAHEGSGMCSMMLGDFSKAVSSFERSLRIDPESAKSRANLGLSYFYLGNLLSAREAFGTLKRQDPSSLWAWAGEGLVHYAQGRIFNAWFCLQHVQAVEPEHPWVMSLEEVVERPKIDDEAFRLVVDALSLPEVGSRWRMAAARFLALGEPRQALALARCWEETCPGDREARRHVALHLYGCRFLAEAAATTRRITEARPQDLWTGLIRHAALVDLDMQGLADDSLRAQLGGQGLDPWLVALAKYRLGELERGQIDALVMGTQDEELRTVRALEQELFAPDVASADDPEALVELQALAISTRRAKLNPLAQAAALARPNSAQAALGAARSIALSWPVNEDLHHWFDAVPDGYTIQLPAHGFHITKLLQVSGRKGLTLRGRTNARGRPATRIHFSNPSASQAVALFLECDDLTLESIMFDHAEDEISASRECVLRLMNCERVTLRNCKLVRGLQGVYAQNVKDLVLDRLQIEQMKQAGLWLESVTGISITESTLTKCNIYWMGSENAGPFHEQGNMRGLYNVWHPTLEEGHCR